MSDLNPNSELPYIEKLKRNNDWKFQDPRRKEPSSKGLLLSDEIRAFCDRGLLIQNWNPEQLRPASYTMTIGPEYVDSKGKEGTLTRKKSFFYMEPNSIVYVSPAERLNLPYYIVARCNLRVKWVYKGILLGTGPQIDPGFVGRLSCPLFNLTGQKVKIKLGDEFATIDFERTSGFCENSDLETIKNSIVESEPLDELKIEDRIHLLFKQKEYPALKHLPEWQVVSSLAKMEKEVKTWRRIGIGTAIALFALALALLNFQTNLYSEVLTLAKHNSNSQARINSLEHTVQANPAKPSEPDAHNAPAEQHGDKANQKGSSGKTP